MECGRARWSGSRWVVHSTGLVTSTASMRLCPLQGGHGLRFVDCHIGRRGLSESLPSPVHLISRAVNNYKELIAAERYFILKDAVPGNTDTVESCAQHAEPPVRPRLTRPLALRPVPGRCPE